MKLIMGERNRANLSELLKIAMVEADYVQAAIAYVSDDQTLIKQCFSRNIPLTLFGRYDYSQPVAFKILERFLQRNSADFVFKFVPDIFHPKIIWWHGFGAYIGSANLTQRAWFKNYEAGVFLTDEELRDEEMDVELRLYFEELDTNAHPLTRELVEEAKYFDSEQSALTQAMKKARDEFAAKRSILPLAGLSSINKKSAQQRWREKFLMEWNATIQILRDLAGKAYDRRPSWVDSDVPPGIVVDRFLHDYYYYQVREGNRFPIHDFHQKNFKRAELATNEALAWWGNLPSASVGEIERLNEWPKLLRPLLGHEKLPKLSEDEFEAICSRINAIRDHSSRVSWKSYGLTAPLPRMEVDDRVHQLAKYVYAQRSRDGSTALETLDYIIYGGPDAEIPSRIFECSFGSKKIRHLGVSAFGEIVGCAKPDFSPPRNGRTSKALYALGYKVTIHSGG